MVLFRNLLLSQTLRKLDLRRLSDISKTVHPNVKWLKNDNAPRIHSEQKLETNFPQINGVLNTSPAMKKINDPRELAEIDHNVNAFDGIFKEPKYMYVPSLVGIQNKSWHLIGESQRDRGQGNDRFPTGVFRQDRFPSHNTEMDLTFVGTASCSPTTTRGVSCTALRFEGETYLFDCGESSQLKLQSTTVSIGNITKIFITHLHGDHSFGLPGVLCNLGAVHRGSQDDMPDQSYDLPVIDIYGPEGLRTFLRSALQMTYSKIVVPYRVHEIMDIPHLHFKRKPIVPVIQASLNQLYGERPGGNDIYPQPDGTYNLCKGEEMRVRAAPLKHTTPCVGFVVEERTKLGKLRYDLVSQHIEDNKEELMKLPLIVKYGQRHHKKPVKDALSEASEKSQKSPLTSVQPRTRFDYRKIAHHLKLLKPDESFVFPNGVEFFGRDVNNPPVKGRKIVILGDTCNSDMMTNIAMDADVLVHEATNAHLPTDPSVSARHDSYDSQEREAMKRGHSTPQMAGRFAKKIRAKKLILNHFSARYLGLADPFAMKIMWAIEDQARVAAEGLKGDNDVVAAWDSMVMSIPRCV